MRKVISFLLIWMLCLSLFIEVGGQKKKPKFKGSGRFIPGKTKLTNKGSSANPRTRGPTLGDIISRGRGQQGQQRRLTNQNVDHSDSSEVNRMNYLNNMRNNKNAHNNNANSGGNQYPNIGKVTAPLRRSHGEKPPFAPSWTHCVISVQVSIAWIVVTSPRYPEKFQGQVQCSWIATAPEGYRVRLSFKDLDLLQPSSGSCGNQFVELIDMTLEKSQARFCGRKTPGDYVSEGNKLRLDLQADAISIPHKGFMAAFRADQEIPGMRETSYFSDGQPQLMYNPLTDAPPSNPQYSSQRKMRRPQGAAAPQRAQGIPGQNIYGLKDQPRHQKPDKEQEPDALGSSTTHLYIIIAVILVILFGAAAAYLFKRYFYKQAKAWWKQRRGGRNGGESIEIKAIEDPYSFKKNHPPGSMPLPPTPNQQSSSNMRRQSVSFKGSDYAESDMSNQQPYPLSRPPSYHSQPGQLSRSHSMNDISNGWISTNEDPIYEEDALSSSSVASSFRSSNRHPDHETFKRQKIMERQNSLRVRRNSLGPEMESYMMNGRMIPVYNPYKTNSLYGSQSAYMYNPSQDVYGSLPPTFGPGHSNAYNFLTNIPQAAQKELYTSSMTDIPTSYGNHNDFMMQQYRGRSASVYDLTSGGSVELPDMPTQWSTQLGQRQTSVTSSTNNSTASTNPILKKTTPEPQNELAFSALRAAKSMNDLTAINTKLNECVSWTLPAQRIKSFADLS